MIYLYIFSVIAMGSHGGSNADWVFMGKFESPAACHAAAANLNKTDKHHRCINSGDGSVK